MQLCHERRPVVQPAAETWRAPYLRFLAPRFPLIHRFVSFSFRPIFGFARSLLTCGGRLGWFGHRSRPRIDDRSLSLGREFHETIGQLSLKELGLQHAAHIIAASKR